MYSLDEYIKNDIKNDIIKNINNIEYMMNNLLYYYIYNRFNKSDVIELIALYNEINEDNFKIDILDKKNRVFKISNNKEYKKIELIEE